MALRTSMADQYPEEWQFLERLAEEVRRLGDVQAVDTHQALDARLTGGASAGSIGGGGPVMPRSPAASEVGRTLGNTLPLNQQTNLLANPTFEDGYDGASKTIGVGETQPIIGWYVLKTGGTAAACLWIPQDLRTLQPVNPFHSTTEAISIVPTGSGTHQVNARCADVALTARTTTADAPFIVAALAVGQLRSIANTLTNVTSRSVVLELYNSTDATVVASQTFDLTALPDGVGGIFRLMCSAPVVMGKQYQLRWSLIIVTSGSGANIQYSFAEPQLQLAYTQDPGPYTPAVGGWVPIGVRNQAGGSPREGSGLLLTGTGKGTGYDGGIDISPNGVVNFRNNAGDRVGFYHGGANNVLRFASPADLPGETGAALEFVERSDPAAPAANEARLYVRDNGSGKSQLVIRFNTGAIQILATEP